LLLFVTAFLLIAGEGYSAEEEDDGILEMRFKWAIILVDHKGERGTLSITKNTTIFSGDSLSIFIQPKERSYIYLYLVDSKDDLSLLFPASISDFDKDYSFGKEYRIPKKGRWLTIDQHKGTETFFLLASVKRLEKLESLTNAHMSASGRAREAAKLKVIAEIKEVKRDFSRLKVFAEKPTPILGTMRRRGGEEDTEINSYAIEVTAKDIYSKTIRLEHK
ncbi:MAG: DUF4384 domain-containing protein, partial [Candidatus Omnitrophota bacterium]